MDRITRAEYKILRKCVKEPHEFDEKQVEDLLKNQYLLHNDFKNQNGILIPTSRFYKISHEGRLAYEHYHDTLFERRMVSFRAWLALALSAISITVTIIHSFFF